MLIDEWLLFVQVSFFFGVIVIVFALLIGAPDYVAYWSTRFYIGWTQSSGWRHIVRRSTYAFLLLQAYFGATTTDPSVPVPPLYDSKDSLRLARLLRGRSTIEVELLTYTFLDAPKFDALSYQWGQTSPLESRYILVNGQPKNVTENLFAALHQLRAQGAPRMLWVDALCIDQANVTEKNRQIPLMAFIYSRAWHVQAWLGDSDYVDGLEVFRMRRDGFLKDEPENVLLWSKNYWWIHDLLFSEYWKRMWVIQELLAAREVIFRFGKESLTLSEISAFAEAYITTPKTLVTRDTLPAFRTIQAVKEFRQARFTHPDRLRLQSLLFRFQDSMSGEPRDKIYALLGIANDVLRDDIPVDYSRSLYEVYADVMTFFNRKYGQEQVMQLEMMKIASHVRRLLTRPQVACPLSRSFARPAKTDMGSWILNEVRDCAKNDPDEACKVLRYLWPIQKMVEQCQHSIQRARSQHNGTCWAPSSLEYIEQWSSADYSLEPTDVFTVTAVLRDYVMPSNLRDIDIITRADAERQWRAFVNTMSPADEAQKRLFLGRNERLLHLLALSSRSWQLMYIRRTHLDPSLPAGDNFLLNLGSGPRTAEHPWEQSWWAGGVLALGGHTGLVGVVPENVCYGDLLAQFWQTSGAAVLRTHPDVPYHIVGRAGVLHSADGPFWDRPDHAADFLANSSDTLVVHLRMNLKMLTALSLNSEFLPGTIQ